MAFADLLGVTDRLVLKLLGETVLYQPELSGPVEVVGVFTNAYALGTVNDVGVENTTPAVFLRLADLAAAGFEPERDNPRITRSGVEYRVRERKRDGDGGILLLLIEV